MIWSKKSILHFLDAVLVYLQSAVRKKQLIVLSEEQFTGKSWQKSNSQFPVSCYLNWSKRYVTLSYCYTGLWAGCSMKEVIDGFFLEHFKRNLWKYLTHTFSVSYSPIWLEKRFCTVSLVIFLNFNFISTGCSMERAIGNKN